MKGRRGGWRVGWIAFSRTKWLEYRQGRKEMTRGMTQSILNMCLMSLLGLCGLQKACLKLWISFCASTSSPGTVMTAELPSCRSWSIYPYRTTIPFDKITSFH
ncbi:Mis6 domain-containing protein [Histoplasma capsulatum G186AR]|uniref:Mis6 domain-containing protein n=1 Tax=Ajellomyces capsulatus TaxID=5037 RepID=A0A8H7Z7U0_AJECA|nr:Mis6 domain-containing protein [Histoplasma capsulatum]QSS68985.1 Mis6 domain-containing protein [Histoplasma capsulatum G186AR]